MLISNFTVGGLRQTQIPVLLWLLMSFKSICILRAVKAQRKPVIFLVIN